MNKKERTNNVGTSTKKTKNERTNAYHPCTNRVLETLSRNVFLRLELSDWRFSKASSWDSDIQQACRLIVGEIVRR